jgi:hypothetical protein
MTGCGRVHCPKASALRANNSAPDVLTDEPGGYSGFAALYGNVSVQPQIFTPRFRTLQ